MADLKTSIKEGAIRRAERDRHLAEEWVCLEDTLSPEEEKLVGEGEAPPRRGGHIHWEDVKKT